LHLACDDSGLIICEILSSEMEASFREIAADLLSRTTLMMNDAAMKILEVEMYYTNKEHPDPYTHCHPRQLRFGEWYYHRIGRGIGADDSKGIKEGTYCGLDLTLGDDETYFGILIRSIEDQDGHVVNGPCLVVRHLMSLANVTTAKALSEIVEQHPTTTGPLSLVYDKDAPTIPMYHSPRVGLAMKSKGLVHAHDLVDYRWAPYRYVNASKVNEIKKGFDMFAIQSLLECDMDISKYNGPQRYNTYRTAVNEIMNDSPLATPCVSYIDIKLSTTDERRAWILWWNQRGQQKKW
jgi:hypothetical protein